MRSARWSIVFTDLVALEASLRESVLQPLYDVAELLEKHEKITRLYTTMSTNEMTKDPLFEFNPDLEDVSRTHTAIQKLHDRASCTENRWVITLEDGTEVFGQGNQWPHALGNANFSPNVRILQYSASGSTEFIGDMAQANLTAQRQALFRPWL